MKLTVNYKRSIIFILSVICTLLLCTGCFTTGPYTEHIINPDMKFIYVLQNIDFDKLSSTKFKIAVVDPDESQLTAKNLTQLHNQDKILLAYLSIGEAEEYRDYWKHDWKTGNPSFIDQENPDWEGNYKVMYWYEQWQEITFSRLDQIINSGYDGVYLDIIDVYRYFQDSGFDFARKEMIDLVIGISKKSKGINRDFLVIPQNSEELLIYKGYLAAIDGIGREDLCYIDNLSQDTEELETALQYLKKAIDAGKLVLVISYPTEHDKKCNFIKMAVENNFMPYVGKRELDTIETTTCN